MLKNKRCIISGMEVRKLSFGFNEDSTESQRLKKSLLDKIVMLHRDGVTEFYTDCEFGFALWGGEIVAGLMNYNDIMLFGVYPHENQSYKFAENWRDRFFKLHEVCTEVIPTYLEYNEETGETVFSCESEETLKIRAADYMLNVCGRVLFCGDGEDSYIFNKAKTMGLDITVLDLEAVFLV